MAKYQQLHPRQKGRCLNESQGYLQDITPPDPYRLHSLRHCNNIHNVMLLCQERWHHGTSRELLSSIAKVLVVKDTCTSYAPGGYRVRGKCMIYLSYSIRGRDAAE
ncbi:hypothetical protein BDR07DRAFT_1387063 [Suillus spraguei]|nr:hypothetical protein BDR07DRAFT_1387063 [Suillus spraguei]